MPQITPITANSTTPRLVNPHLLRAASGGQRRGPRERETREGCSPTRSGSRAPSRVRPQVGEDPGVDPAGARPALLEVLPSHVLEQRVPHVASLGAAPPEAAERVLELGLQLGIGV